MALVIGFAMVYRNMFNQKTPAIAPSLTYKTAWLISWYRFERDVWLRGFNLFEDAEV
jgi:hypothetical protein